MILICILSYAIIYYGNFFYFIFLCCGIYLHHSSVITFQKSCLDIVEYSENAMDILLL